MKAFECALRIVRGNILFLLVYVVGLSFMGVFMAQSFGFGAVDETLQEQTAEFSVVDRDGSSLSRGLEEFLESRGIAVFIEDSTQAFQDAVAKGQTDYLLVIPAGYGQAFQEAARAGADAPQMDVVYSYYAANGALMDEAVNTYLSCVRTFLIETPDCDLSMAVGEAARATDESVAVQTVDTKSGMTEADRFVFYLQWSTYTLFAGIVVCVGMLITTMNRADVRRRNLASPLSYASYNVQLALACAVLAFASCAWTFLLGVVAFPAAAAAISLEGLVFCGLSILCYSCMALAFGFMLGQFGVSSLMCNAAGNIFGMVISFLGGAWISLDVLSPEVVMLAHWLPGFWYTDACRLSAHMTPGGPTGEVLLDMGILLLFAMAFLSVGFVAAKKRLQTSEAGGNRSAETAVGF